METIHVTDEQVQTARVEDALRDVAQRLMGLGLPVAVSAMPEINRLLACQETHSTIYVGFSNQNRMFGDDIATLRFAMFRRLWRRARPARNPKTGESGYEVPARFVVSIKPSPVFQGE